ncbi:MAG: type II secretion system F family protein [Candidatus Omnitrophica bacterium]|nr:type II secretion system F family protein [Candidatus Omnitrophota bacterium]
MPTYKYRVRDSSGKIVTGTVEAVTESAAISNLDASGYLPISVSLLKEKKSLSFLKARIKPRDLVIFTRQLATIVRSSIPILSGLTALSAQTENEELRRILSGVKANVEAGLTLSSAFAKYPDVFPELYISTIRAGETGGVLAKILEKLAELLEHEAETAANLKSAVRYPVSVIVALVSAFLFLTAFIIPKFSSIYASAGSALPLPTRMLILLSDILRRYWYLLIIGIFFIIWSLRRYIKTKKGQWQWDGLKLKIPIFGPLFIKMAMSRFAQMLSTLDQSGLPILRTLEVVSKTIGNVVIAKELEMVRESIEEGKSLADPLLESKLFPPLVSHMVAIGERSGTMDALLDDIQHYYDTEVNSTIKNLTTLIEPLLTVGLGIAVLFLALAMFLPMWNLISVFKGG